MSLTAIKNGITLDQLDAWGTVADLGSEILEGEVKCFGKMTAGAPTDPVSAAYFGTTQGKFRMVYPFNEQATVVTGEVVLTDEVERPDQPFQGRRQLVRDQRHAGAVEVVSDSFVKHYYAVA